MFQAIFDRVFINMVGAGEAGGALEIILERMVVWYDQDERIEALSGRAMEADRDDLLNMADLGRSTFLLSLLVGAGVPILEAVALTRDCCRGPWYERLYQQVFESIREGDTITQPFGEAQFVPRMAVVMIEVGEETGDLDTALRAVGEHFLGELERQLRS